MSDPKEYPDDERRSRRAKLLENSLREYVEKDLSFEIDEMLFLYRVEEIFVNPETLSITVLYRPADYDGRYRI